MKNLTTEQIAIVIQAQTYVSFNYAPMEQELFDDAVEECTLDEKLTFEDLIAAYEDYIIL
jgi:hypothetical protein